MSSQVIHGVWRVGFSSLSGIMSSAPRCAHHGPVKDPRNVATQRHESSGRVRRWRSAVNICILHPHHPTTASRAPRPRSLSHVLRNPMQRFSPRVTALLAGALLLVACRGEPTAPIAADASTPRLAPGGNGNGGGRANGPSSLDLIEEDFAGGLLDKENGNRYRAYAVLAPEKLPRKYQSSERGKDATYSMVQLAKDWGTLSKATQKEIRDLRGNGFGNLKQTRETPHFVLQYTTQGDWAVPTVDADGNGHPDFIDASAKSWEEVYARQVGQLGYPAPKLTATADGSVSNKFHVYFKDMLYYGYCVPENVEFAPVNGFPSGTASAWIVVESDFYGFPPNDEDVTGDEVVRTGALK